MNSIPKINIDPARLDDLEAQGKSLIDAMSNEERQIFEAQLAIEAYSAQIAAVETQIQLWVARYQAELAKLE